MFQQKQAIWTGHIFIRMREEKVEEKVVGSTITIFWQGICTAIFREDSLFKCDIYIISFFSKSSKFAKYSLSVYRLMTGTCATMRRVLFQLPNNVTYIPSFSTTFERISYENCLSVLENWSSLNKILLYTIQGVESCSMCRFVKATVFEL